jgi:hypothetical protein
MNSHASTTLHFAEQMAKTSLKAMANKLSNDYAHDYVKIESMAYDNTPNRNIFPTPNFEKKLKKGNKKTMERDKARKDKYVHALDYM